MSELLTQFHVETRRDDVDCLYGCFLILLRAQKNVEFELLQCSGKAQKKHSLTTGRSSQLRARIKRNIYK